MASNYIQWPSKEVRHQQRVARIDEVFGNCIGYIDGSEIALRDKPKHDHEAYFSKKKVYGFNLQVNLFHQILSPVPAADVKRQSATLKAASFMPIWATPPAVMTPPLIKRLHFTKSGATL